MRAVWISLFLGLWGTACDGPAPSSDYARPELLVDLEWVDAHLGAADLVIVDARSTDAYYGGHIPGAISLQWQQFSNMAVAPGEDGYGVVLPPSELADALAAAGIDETKTVVAYADPDDGWGEDGRMIWVLHLAGLTNAKLMNGGFSRWLAEGYPITQDPTSPSSTALTLTGFDESLTIDTDALKGALTGKVIVDARTEAEYEGAVLYGEARGGHIPGAILIPFTSVFEDNGFLKSQAELESLFGEHAIEKDDEIVVYCTGGIRSAHLAMVFRLAGYVNAANYDDSFWRWSAAQGQGLPVE